MKHRSGQIETAGDRFAELDPLEWKRHEEEEVVVVVVVVSICFFLTELQTPLFSPQTGFCETG
jgi:hypothetical protein